MTVERFQETLSTTKGRVVLNVNKHLERLPLAGRLTYDKAGTASKGIFR